MILGFLIQCNYYAMKKIFVVFVLLAASFCHAAGTSPMMFGMENASHIFINNRVLAKANGKAISVYDVMKKMDMLFYKQYPEYTSSVMARFQFYQINWKSVLRELIDKELIIADAEEQKLPITNGDVRQEMETLFGPNIIFNLDKVGLTYQEAWQMVKDDLTIRRMIYIRSNAKAIKKITPLEVKKAYEKYAEKNRRPEQWEYQVVSIRDDLNGLDVANHAHRLLVEEKVPLNDLVNKIRAEPQFAETKITVTEQLQHGVSDLSPLYKEELSKLTPPSYSEPIAQKSRKDSSTVYRIFYLKDRVAEGVTPFKEMESKLRDELIQGAAGKETEAYFKRLRDHYHVQADELISDEIQPFILR